MQILCPAEDTAFRGGLLFDEDGLGFHGLVPGRVDSLHHHRVRSGLVEAHQLLEVAVRLYRIIVLNRRLGLAPTSGSSQAHERLEKA